MPGAPTTFATLHVEHSSTVDRAAAELRRAIFDGEIESGTPLRELALAESLGVSRPTVREALGMLVAEGLATRQPNRGVNVAAPEASSVRDVCRARFVLEGAGVLRWAEADQVDRDHVRACLRDYTDSVAAGASYQELNQRHLAFHVSLVGLTQSARLVSMAELLVVELKLALAQVDRLRRNAHDQADSHTALVTLMEDGDLAGAHEFLREHLSEAADAILNALQVS
ncbi:GntR family transcriptional regulator [Nocardioides sp.]|uniref:GntR family transcriptional regulator n=1 Tax=Nocardioides sp. TaxID=35761 RepID=UPI000C8A69A4|nr:GntR family transcriptional regulator [Nocardioides sp.]MAS56240.1 GntR family transcriptional regulator [Pimelobacter sp.]MDE0775038.1 GntR family transcriptional regulator [Nocardioides sp.]